MKTRSQLSENNPEVIITAFIKRGYRLPLTLMETAAIMQTRGVKTCSHGNIHLIEKQAKAKIRRALEETMFARGTKENTPDG